MATVVTVLLGLPAAFVLHRLRFPGRGLLRAFVLVPFVLPTVVVGVAFRQLLGAVRPARLPAASTARPSAIVAALVFFNARRRDPRRRRAVGVARPAPRGGRGRARRLARGRCSARSPCRRCGPAIVSAASVVFLFCATAFGIVLTLGGLRYSSVETEIYLLTTQLLDLQAAAALSVLQLLVVVGCCCSRRQRPAHAGAAVDRDGGARRRPAAAPRRRRRLLA